MADKGSHILPDDVQRMLGKDAQRNNILAARILAETVKTTLGPKGMDKMLVNSASGDIIVTNDGVTILEEMDIEHPAAKMIVEIARTQEDEVGDGTTTAVMLVGKLLENAEKLLDQKIHPTVIAKGYRLATEMSMQFLREQAFEISTEEELLKVAQTAMTGKGAEYVKEKFDDIIVNAIKVVAEDGKVNLDNIKIEKQKGHSVEDSELIKGIVLDHERVSSEMPKIVNDARIALVDCSLEVKTPEAQTSISVSSPSQLHEFLEQEENYLRNLVNKIKEVGANLVICQRGIDEMAQYFLAKNGIYALRRIAKSDMEKLAMATGARIVSNIKDMSSQDLGYARVVEELKRSGVGMTYVRDCKNPKSLTILIRGGTDHVIDEIERALKDGLGDVAATLESSLVVAGGGAVEMELSRKLKEYSKSVQGRESLAIAEFANALEFIPLTLAENAGLDPIDVLTELRASHESGNGNDGLNLFTERIENTLDKGIIEPLKIKTQAISSASEISTMILRIDDVIASSAGKKPGHDLDNLRQGLGE
jgi:archaeal chaperonin